MCDENLRTTGRNVLRKAETLPGNHCARRSAWAMLAVLALAATTPVVAQQADAAAQPAADEAATDNEQGVRERLPPCESAVKTNYEQWNTSARVDGTVENTTCGASKGDFTLYVSILDAAGEAKVIEAKQSWQRDDDQPVSFVVDVPIGNNAELRRVRGRSNHCYCLDAPASAE